MFLLCHAQNTAFLLCRPDMVPWLLISICSIPLDFSLEPKLSKGHTTQHYRKHWSRVTPNLLKIWAYAKTKSFLCIKMYKMDNFTHLVIFGKHSPIYLNLLIALKMTCVHEGMQQTYRPNSAFFF